LGDLTLRGDEQHLTDLQAAYGVATTRIECLSARRSRASLTHPHDAPIEHGFAEHRNIAPAQED
jgi:hypothetical protein